MDENSQFDFFDTLFLRSPFYSFEDFSYDQLPEIITQPAFRNALWLASPDFYRVLEAKNFDWSRLEKKEQFSLCKYYNRMSFRPTPFGAFSSFSLVNWYPGSSVKLCREENAILHILPSRQWQEQNDQIWQRRDDLLLRANPTLFRFGKNYRFIRSASSESGKLKFRINELKAEKLNVKIIEQCKSTAVSKRAIMGKIASLTSCTACEAVEYLSFLINEQVLMTQYHGSLIQSATGHDQPADLWQHMAALPLSGCFSLPALAMKAENVVNAYNLKKGVFYGCLERKAERGGLDPSWQKELISAIDLLRRIVIPYPSPALEEFKNAFSAKFESRRVPLLQALDPDGGISYGGSYAAATKRGFLEDLAFPSRSTKVQPLDWNAVHRLFLRLWVRNPNRSFYQPVVIPDSLPDELERMPITAKLPPSLAVLFTKAGDKVILDNTGGASALSLTGRFSVFSADVERLCKETAVEEIAMNPGVIFAEVHQLSDNHVDNINRRVPLYDHTITINTFPAVAGQQEIALSDLLLSVREGELVLESEKLKKRIMPRLPTAYNFHHNELGIFQLLCDLQFQGLQANLTFDLEKLFPGLDFYPRVEYRNTVISVARWKINTLELRDLLRKPLSLGRLHQFRQNHGIPEVISTGLSDQQLTFNLVDDRQAMFFLECLNEHQSITIREYIMPDRTVTAGGKALSGQFVALLKNPASVYQMQPLKTDSKKRKTQRQFLPGSSWLYLKIYCTPESADQLLVKMIAPFIKSNAKDISEWFFIRYQDPEPHLRLRIRSRQGDAAPLLTAFNKMLSRNQYKDLAKEVKNETYERELERYGEELIEEVETFFCTGSEWTLNQLSAIVQGHIDDAELVKFCLVYLLAFDFLKDNAAVSDFFKWRSDSFLQEFGGEKELRVKLDSKYRMLGKSLRLLLEAQQFKDMQQLRDQLAVISLRSEDWLPRRRNILLADLIHMQVNRMFFTAQRQHEALICYCLYKYGVSVKARTTDV
jgi:thiopeptide-type bacteriocin biosynthesis protein